MRQRRTEERVCVRCGKSYVCRADQPQRFCGKECKHPPVAERFWALVNRTDSCWLWRGTKRMGYGLFQIGGRMRSAHRVAFEWANGPIPDGLDLLHRCDVTNCVNPAHLFLGTHQDNMRDMVSKRRNRGPWKLSPEAAAAIRASKERPVDLAVRYGVSPSLISNIRAGRVWRACA